MGFPFRFQLKGLKMQAVASDNNVSQEDCRTLNRLGRLYAHHHDVDAQREAAMMLASTLNLEEESRALYWLNEGLRDYAGSDDRLMVMVKSITDLAYTYRMHL